MPGKRMLHDKVCESEKLSRISFYAETLYYRILTRVDDYGDFSADPRLVRAACFPLRDGVTVENVQAWLTELYEVRGDADREHGLLIPYEASGQKLLYFHRFTDFQKLNRGKMGLPQYPLHPRSINHVLGNINTDLFSLDVIKTDLNALEQIKTDLHNEGKVREVNVSQDKIVEEGPPLAFSGKRLVLTDAEHLVLKTKFPEFCEEELRMTYQKIDLWAAGAGKRGLKRDWPKMVANWLKREEPIKGSSGLTAVATPGTTAREIAEARKRREYMSPESIKQMREIQENAGRGLAAKV